jgi:DNA-binding NarL/FixJ family response regulator
VSPVPQFGTPKLLIADDDAVMRFTLETLLGDEFDVVGLAADAEEAVALAEDFLPDVAIIDVQMPGGGGVRATREIRARVPGTAIMILSGDEEHSSVVELLVAGASSYVLKGLSPCDLADRLRESIAAHTQLAIAAC